MIIPQIASAFSDVYDSYRYETAINYLQKHELVNGYPDGTYRPDSSLTRVEFLKLAMVGSNIEPEPYGVSGFVDVDENSWYAPYIRKAKNEGWAAGYDGNLFKPEQKISKVEGLKILAKIQNWPDPVNQEPLYKDIKTGDWFFPYVNHAKSRNFLEENGYFIPDEILSRGRFADIMYRTHITAANNADIYSTKLRDVTTQVSTIPEPDPKEIPMPVLAPAPELNFKPVEFNMTDNDFFNDFTLTEELPNHFYLNEIYNFQGTINKGSYTKAFVFLAEDVSKSDNFIDYIGEVQNNKVNIPVVFRKPGNYKLGLILGSQGESKVVDISVLPSLPKSPSTNNSSKPLKTDVTYAQDSTTVSWDSNTNELLRINIYQGKKTFSYITRQKEEAINIVYSDFAGFKEGTTYLQIDGAKTDDKYPLKISTDWAHGEPMKFTATGHQFSTIETEDVKVNNFSDYSTTLQNIKISGTTNGDIYQEAIITLPDGTVTEKDLTSSKPLETYFGSKIILKGNDFHFTYTPKTNGTYIIEINGKDGSAVINVPIYIKTGIPLTPDYFDLHKTNEQDKNFDLVEARNDLLKLINDDRSKYGLSNVEIDSSLNNLAQLHSEDMAENNYFSHISLDGKTPDQRRIDAKIPTAVGENLAQAPNIFYSHFGLMRSGVHRKNTLDPKWTRVGIGIAANADGQLLVSEEFSTYPLSSIDIANLRGSYLEKMNDYRLSKPIPELSIENSLATIAQSWSEKMADQNFFDFESPNGESLTSIVQKNISGKAVQALILESSDPDKLIDEILNTDEVGQSQWTKIGIGLEADNIGDLKATLLFTTH